MLKPTHGPLCPICGLPTDTDAPCPDCVPPLRQKLRKYLNLLEVGFAKHAADQNHPLTFNMVKAYHGITDKAHYEAYQRGEVGLHKPTHISVIDRQLNVSEKEIRETIEQLNDVGLTETVIDKNGIVRGIIKHIGGTN